MPKTDCAVTALASPNNTFAVSTNIPLLAKRPEYTGAFMIISILELMDVVASTPGWSIHDG